jgi:HK97 gp10 family phage protein
MKKVGEIRLDTTVLDKITAELEPKAEAHIAKTAFDVEADAKIFAPVRYGFLRNSIEAIKKSKFLWWIQDGVDYGIYQELGTYKMRAQPFMLPALEKNFRAFVDGWKDLFR